MTEKRLEPPSTLSHSFPFVLFFSALSPFSTILINTVQNSRPRKTNPIRRKRFWRPGDSTISPSLSGLIQGPAGIEAAARKRPRNKIRDQVGKMEEEAQSLRYWCYRCSRAVNPLREIGPLNCPICEGGFLEEMETATGQADSGSITSEYPFDSERAALSLWAPILLGMMSNNPRRDRRHGTSSRLRHRIELLEEDHDDEELDDHTTSEHNRDQTELDRELDTIIRRRRRRSSATILHLLQGIRAGMLSETENSEGDDRDRERVILINPFNQSIIVHGSNSSNSNNNNDHSSLGDPP
ncbi:unnamed protein product, partial [Cuscuta europaea]